MKKMLSFLNLKCAACDTVYTLSIEELNIVVLFKCFECGRYNIYVAGHVLELEEQIMNEGTDEQKRRHIIETLQVFICEFAGNVLKNVERVVNVNVEVELPEAARKNRRMKKRTARIKEIQGHRPAPSIQQGNAPGISREEIRDFVKIDLNLIDKKDYFNKFFGREKG